MDETIRKLISSYLPMSEQSFLLLLCLTEPRHGYGIMQMVLEQSQGRVSLGPSTVYTILYKMEQDGLIEVVSEVDRRKVYEITYAGRQVLLAETSRITELSRYARQVMEHNGLAIPALQWYIFTIVKENTIMGVIITLSRFMPLTWLIIAVVLGAVEIATIDLVAIWFALGAFVTIIPAAMGLPFWMQLVVFLAVSFVTLAFTRPIVANVLRVKKTSTNADRIIGMIGVVTTPINNISGEGRVLVNGLDWAARSDDGAPIDVQENVLIKSIEGVKVIVERVV